MIKNELPQVRFIAVKHLLSTVMIQQARF